MKQRKRALWTGGAMLLTIFLAMPALQAQGPRGRGGQMGPRDNMPPMRFLEMLNLTQEQKDKIAAIREKGDPEARTQRKKVQKQHDELRDLMKTDAKEAKLRKAFDMLQDAKRAFALSRFEHVLEIRGLLTPEQRKSFGEASQRFLGKRRGGRRGPPRNQ